MSSKNSINPATAKDLIMYIEKLRKDNNHFRIITDDNIRKLNVRHLENNDNYSKLFFDKMQRKPKLNQKKLKDGMFFITDQTDPEVKDGKNKTKKQTATDFRLFFLHPNLEKPKIYIFAKNQLESSFIVDKNCRGWKIAKCLLHHHVAQYRIRKSNGLLRFGDIEEKNPDVTFVSANLDNRGKIFSETEYSVYCFKVLVWGERSIKEIDEIFFNPRGLESLRHKFRYVLSNKSSIYKQKDISKPEACNRCKFYESELKDKDNRCKLYELELKNKDKKIKDLELKLQEARLKISSV